MCVRGKDMVDTKSNNPVPNFYRASAEDFKKIPGSPIAYWVSEKILRLFDLNTVKKFFKIEFGIKTGDNDLFLKKWYEVNLLDTNIKKFNHTRWIKHSKGGEFRKWYGNIDYVIDWRKPSNLMNISHDSPPDYYDSYKQGGISWSEITSNTLCTRYIPSNILSNNKAPIASNNDINENYKLLLLTNNKIYAILGFIINPSLSFPIGDFAKLPYPDNFSKIDYLYSGTRLINISKNDWDSYETSWDFTTLPLISPDYLTPTIEASYQKLRSHWQEMTTEMKELEEENNKIFIEAYGLQDELTPDVPLSEITLTCNPHYRYDASKPEEELEALLRTDTIKELISYAVGCMFGRYSLDKPGLILANQGETVEDYLKQVPHPTFRPDDDNIIPVLDDEYFPDDIVGRFKNFLKIVFGEKTLSQNLDYIAQALTGKSTSSPEKVIRDYFLKDFFKDHVQRYKKRPIYWMFSSGKQQGFNALIYMHRYNKTTLAKMRTDYLLELEAKLDAELTALSEDPVKNKARISKIKKQIDEMKTWDELLNNKALALIEIDLDDGVVVNYAKFKGLVRAI